MDASTYRDRVRYVFVDRILKVEQKEFTVGGKKTADGKAELFLQSGGWYMTLGSTMLSIKLGDDKPALQAGDKIRITIEKI